MNIYYLIVNKTIITIGDITMDQDVKLSVRQIVRILLSSDDVRHFEKIFYFSKSKFKSFI